MIANALAIWLSGSVVLVPVRADHRADCTGAGDVGNYFHNFCEEKCVCEEILDATGSGTGLYDHRCYREREEFTCMSSASRTRFMDAYKAVTTPGHPQYHQMEMLIQKHDDGFWNGIHDTQYFLPWHRWYAMAVENILRNEDCRVTLPWWRWSKKSTTWYTGTPFHAGTTWLGTDGGAGSCVTDGAFGSWAPPLSTGCLQRSFQTWNSMPTGGQVTAVLNLPHTDFGDFSDQLEGTIHNGPHNRIGGHMASLLSPRAPEFFLHHGYIDQLWDRWQRKSANHLTAYQGFSPTADLPYTYGNTPSNVQDHFDLKKSGVIYVNYKSHPSGPGHAIFLPKCLWILVSKSLVVDLTELVEGLDGMGPDRLAEIPQQPFRVPEASEFEWWYPKDTTQEELVMKKIEKMQATARSYNQKLTSPVDSPTDFKNEASQMLGYDLEKVMEVAGICPLAQKWNGRRCVNDGTQRELKLYVRKQIRRGVIMGGELYSNSDLQGGGRRLSPLNETINLV